jgi:hypothetical protein
LGAVVTFAWSYVAALVLALLAAILRKCPWRWFALALALWLLQAINVNLAQPTTQWTRTWWRYPEALSMLATAAACVEAIERTREFAGEPFRRFQLRVASFAIPASIVGLGIYFVAPFDGDSMRSFNQGRMWLWIGLALALLIVELLVDLQGIARPSGVRWHLRLLLAVMLAHAALSPLWGIEDDATWQLLRRASRLVTMVCCAGWVLTAKNSAR